MKAAVFYETGDATMEEIRAVYPRHKAYLNTFVERGVVLGIGPFDGEKQGSMGIFTTREEAENFIKQDPFVIEGLAGKVIIRDWKDIM